jgi:hypothetical protein
MILERQNPAQCMTLFDFIHFVMFSHVSDRFEFNHYPQPKVSEDCQGEREAGQSGRFSQPSIDQKNARERSYSTWASYILK